MAVDIDRDSTEYLHTGWTGTPPAGGAECALLAAGQRPSVWLPAIVMPDNSHELWADAVASGATGDYFISRLLGPFNANAVVLTQGMYNVWLRLTDVDERPIKIAPVAVNVL